MFAGADSTRPRRRYLEIIGKDVAHTTTMNRSLAKRLGYLVMVAGWIVVSIGLGTAHAVPLWSRCSYRFDSAMPPDTFCVYRGIARDSSGEACADDVVVLWSSYGAAGEASAEIYLGFIASPDLVLRATVKAQDDHQQRAQLLDYAVGGDESARPIHGEASLRAPPPQPGAPATADVLSLALSGGIDLDPASRCRFTTYSGEFMAMIGPTLETAASH